MSKEGRIIVIVDDSEPQSKLFGNRLKQVLKPQYRGNTYIFNDKGNNLPADFISKIDDYMAEKKVYFLLFTARSASPSCIEFLGQNKALIPLVDGMFVDYNMPTYNGDALISMVRREHEAASSIYITGMSAAESGQQKSGSQTFDDFWRAGAKRSFSKSELHLDSPENIGNVLYVMERMLKHDSFMLSVEEIEESQQRVRSRLALNAEDKKGEEEKTIEGDSHGVRAIISTTPYDLTKISSENTERLTYDRTLVTAGAEDAPAAFQELTKPGTHVAKAQKDRDDKVPPLLTTKPTKKQKTYCVIC